MLGFVLKIVSGVKAGDQGWAFHRDPLPVLHAPSDLPQGSCSQVPPCLATGIAGGSEGSDLCRRLWLTCDHTGGSLAVESDGASSSPPGPWGGSFLHWRRKWQPTPVSLPGESHGQRSLVGYSPRPQVSTNAALGVTLFVSGDGESPDSIKPPLIPC